MEPGFNPPPGTFLVQSTMKRKMSDGFLRRSRDVSWCRRGDPNPHGFPQPPRGNAKALLHPFSGQCDAYADVFTVFIFCSSCPFFPLSSFPLSSFPPARLYDSSSRIRGPLGPLGGGRRLPRSPPGRPARGERKGASSPSGLSPRSTPFLSPSTPPGAISGGPGWSGTPPGLLPPEGSRGPGCAGGTPGGPGPAGGPSEGRGDEDSEGSPAPRRVSGAPGGQPPLPSPSDGTGKRSPGTGYPTPVEVDPLPPRAVPPGFRRPRRPPRGVRARSP